MALPELAGLGLALLAIGVIAQYGNYRKGIEAQLNWIASGGLMFLLAATWNAGLSELGILGQITPMLISLFQVLGVIFVLVGTVWSVVRLLKI